MVNSSEKKSKSKPFLLLWGGRTPEVGGAVGSQSNSIPECLPGRTTQQVTNPKKNAWRNKTELQEIVECIFSSFRSISTVQCCQRPGGVQQMTLHARYVHSCLQGGSQIQARRSLKWRWAHEVLAFFFGFIVDREGSRAHVPLVGVTVPASDPSVNCTRGAVGSRLRAAQLAPHSEAS